MSNVTFKCKEERVNPDGSLHVVNEDQEFAVVVPTGKHHREAQKVYNKAFSDAVTSGCILRARLEDFMRSQGLWDDTKETELIKINQKISDAEKKLRAGGFEFEEAVSLAKAVRKYRLQLRDLVGARTELDGNTAEGQADNMRFNYLVSVCLVYNNTKRPVFNDLDDYLSNASTEQAAVGATKLARILYGINEDYESKYEENKFLREFGLADEKNRLINEEGHLVDSEGRLINEEGYYVTPDGKRCDINGNLLDENGEYVIERKPFLKNGKPLVKK